MPQDAGLFKSQRRKFLRFFEIVYGLSPRTPNFLRYVAVYTHELWYNKTITKKGLMIMPSKEMYALGSQASVIRDLFAYGQEQAAVVGRENVFDFSIGNPTVPAPACVKEAIEEIVATRQSVDVHGYTAAAGDLAVRRGLADYMNQTYDAGVRPIILYDLRRGGVPDGHAESPRRKSGRRGNRRGSVFSGIYCLHS